ncbi:hypothetical protein [Candidatus Caldatribacterium sp.]|uniref:hypothetical protein n=1 Tax=Candidatus Caldatribacterium sp. TaxID=2282143 RepID=UPI003845A902|nr:hypothetical protein [Candidatus Caldatribacterium sp.]
MGKVYCKVITEDPKQTGRGVLYTLELSQDIFSMYPKGSILQSDQSYYVVSGADMTLPFGTIRAYTDARVAVPLHEVSYDTSLPLWIRLLHFATQDEILWRTIATLHRVTNYGTLETMYSVTIDETTTIPVMRSGTLPTTSGRELPRGYQTTTVTRPTTSPTRAYHTILDNPHVDTSLKFVLTNSNNLFPTVTPRAPLYHKAEEFFYLYLYGRVKGYERVSQNLDEPEVTSLLTLLKADGLIHGATTLHEAQERLQHLGAFTDHHLSDDLLHILHLFVRILKFTQEGVPNEL